MLWKSTHPFWPKIKSKIVSNKGHGCISCPYSGVLVGCHLRRKVVEFVRKHEATNQKFHPVSHQPTPPTRFDPQDYRVPLAESLEKDRKWKT